jgi:hypothetical protein
MAAFEVITYGRFWVIAEANINCEVRTLGAIVALQLNRGFSVGRPLYCS